MPDLVLDHHRRKVPIDHPDRSITIHKLDVDIITVIYPLVTFPSIWSFPSVTMKTYGA